MRALLDTHAFIWWLVGDRRLVRSARQVLEDKTNEIFVSAASAWEITTKVRIGKLPQLSWFPGQSLKVVREEGFLPLSVTIGHGDRAGSLPRHHRDPFDRMLIAQSQLESLALVSNEVVFDNYGVTRVW